MGLFSDARHKGAREKNVNDGATRGGRGSHERRGGLLKGCGKQLGKVSQKKRSSLEKGRLRRV